MAEDGKRHPDVALREEELSRPEEETTAAEIGMELEEGDLAEGETDEDTDGDEREERDEQGDSPFTEDDFDDEAPESEEEIVELAAGTDDPAASALPHPVIEIIAVPGGYTSYISSRLPRAALFLREAGLTGRVPAAEGQALRLERLQLIAETFIQRFGPWLDNLDHPRRHRFLPACEKKDFYSSWPEQNQNEANRATAIFSTLFIQLPNQEIIFLEDYLGKTDQYPELGAKALTEELAQLMLEEPEAEIRELRELLIAQVRAWGPPDYDITVPGVRYMIKEKIIR